MSIERIEKLLQAAVQTPPEIERLRPIVVYGAGNCGRQVRRILSEDNYEVAAFLDRNGQGQSVDGLPCLSPQDERVETLRQSGATVVIGVWNYTADSRDIETGSASFRSPTGMNCFTRRQASVSGWHRAKAIGMRKRSATSAPPRDCGATIRAATFLRVPSSAAWEVVLNW